jgi:hypothetical protein
MKMRRIFEGKYEASGIKLGNKFLIFTGVIIVALLMSTSLVVSVGVSDLSKDTSIQIEKTSNDASPKSSIDGQKQVVVDNSVSTSTPASDSKSTPESDTVSKQSNDAQPSTQEQITQEISGEEQILLGDGWLGPKFIRFSGNASLQEYQVVGMRANLTLYINSGQMKIGIIPNQIIISPGETVKLAYFLGIFRFEPSQDNEQPQAGQSWITRMFGSTYYKLDDGPSSPPQISFTFDYINNMITVVAADQGYHYSSSTFPSDANLIFVKNNVTYYVNDNLSICTSGILSTKEIQAGDMIHGFSAGTYSIVWKPMGYVLFVFTSGGLQSSNQEQVSQEQDSQEISGQEQILLEGGLLGLKFIRFSGNATLTAFQVHGMRADITLYINEGQMKIGSITVGPNHTVALKDFFGIFKFEGNSPPTPYLSWITSMFGRAYHII